METNEDKKLGIIIQMLKDSKEAAQQADEHVIQIGKDINQIQSYFEGIRPKQHIIHHDLMDDIIEKRKKVHQALLTAIVAVAVSILSLIGNYIMYTTQIHLKEEIKQIVKDQKYGTINRN